MYPLMDVLDTYGKWRAVTPCLVILACVLDVISMSVRQLTQWLFFFGWVVGSW